MGFVASYSPIAEGTDYPGKFVGLLTALDTAAVFGGTVTVTGAFTANGNVAIGDASGDTLTIAPNAVTWSNNPTHSGNHTFTGNLSVNGNTTIGNASGDTLTVAPNAVTWSNNPTHSGNHTFSGTITMTSAGVTTQLKLINTNASGTDKWTSLLTLDSTGAGVTGWASATVLEGDGGGNLVLSAFTGNLLVQVGGSRTQVAQFTSTGLNSCAVGATTASTGAFTTISATGRITTVASASGGSGFRLPHGAAPSSPVDGDVWTTTGGFFVRINGVTKTVTLT